jgi:hypothetical protein
VVLSADVSHYAWSLPGRLLRSRTGVEVSSDNSVSDTSLQFPDSPPSKAMKCHGERLHSDTSCSTLQRLTFFRQKNKQHFQLIGGQQVLHRAASVRCFNDSCYLPIVNECCLPIVNECLLVSFRGSSHLEDLGEETLQTHYPLHGSGCSPINSKPVPST